MPLVPPLPLGADTEVAERLENVPAGMRARYTYEHPSENAYRELFELDMGRGFETYVSNRFVRSGAADR